MSFNYHIYGIRINSTRRIDLLQEQDNSEIDLSVIWLSDKNSNPLPDVKWTEVFGKELSNRKRISFFSSDTSAGTVFKVCFRTNTGNFSFLLSADKTTLWLLHEEQELDTNLNSYFVGVVIGCVLRLREVISLHASVVNIDGKAIVFLGKKKSGKSTTAAAFAKLGYQVLSDDIAAISFRNNEVFIQPGYPKVRLRPKSLVALHEANLVDNFVSVFSHRDSRYTDVEANFYNAALPLGRIYLLAETAEGNATPYIESVSGERLIRLHENVFGSYILTPGLRKKEFETLSFLALNIPVRRLRFGNDLKLVNLQCEAVIKDIV